jgi:putative ATP-dependent endonuclease of the OLD family
MKPTKALGDTFAEIQPEALSKMIVRRGGPPLADEALRLQTPQLTIDHFQELFYQLPEVEFVPQYRKIVPDSEYAVDGQGLARSLRSWQHPTFGRDGLKLRFRRVQQLLRRLLHDDDMELEVSTAEGDAEPEIIVSHHSMRPRLDACGTGVAEIIMLAVAIETRNDAIFCIEEPEIHLHPRLQREFLDHLLGHPTNRFVISSHSNVFICPSEDVNVVHVQMKNNATVGRPVITNSDSLNALMDLGYCASDLLQTNSVIWVEGPSDRVYINKWISLLADDLHEGTDYQIMFYGGRLLSHVTMERDHGPTAEELIPLLKVNQHSAIVIDSDKVGGDDSINETKRRIVDECAKGEVHCWVTDGRTIENYLPMDIVKEIYDAKYQHNGNLTLTKFQDMEGALQSAYPDKRAKLYNHAKAAISREIAPKITTGHIDNELRGRLEPVIKMIRDSSANGG